MSSLPAIGGRTETPATLAGPWRGFFRQGLMKGIDMLVEEKTFYRFISAKELMERWDIDFVKLRQLPLPAFTQTKGMDYSRLNPYSKNCGKGPDLFGAIKKVSPVTKEDFNHVMYDIYSIEQYEHLHPEIISKQDSTIRNEPKMTAESPPLHDFSEKSRAEKKELATRWKAEGQTRYEIGLKLFPEYARRIEAGKIKAEALKKQVTRLINS